MDQGYSHAEICFNAMMPVSKNQFVLEISFVPPSHLRVLEKTASPTSTDSPRKASMEV